MPLLLTLAVCSTWVALAIGFCGIGVVWLRYLTRFQPNWQNAYLAVWTGFGLVMASLLVWHFFLPINALALWIFALVSATSLILERDWFQATLLDKVSPRLVVPAVLFMVWTANHALAQGGMDDYAYEFQAIRWFHDYPIVPGLANLHGRIGFNNSHHLFAAMLSSIWPGAVNHIFNGLFVVLSFTLLLVALADLASARTNAPTIVSALLVSPCAGLVLFGIFGPMISTLKADVFISAATAGLAIFFVEFISTSAEHERHLPLGTAILLLAPVLLSVKITAVVFCGILAAAVVIRLVTTVGWRHRVTVFGTLVAALIICSVFLRGIILSGYPLYPSTLLPANVDWRVPVAQAETERAAITSEAELRPTYDIAAVTGWAWVPAWARSTILTDKFNIVLPAMLTLLCMPLLMARCRRKKPSPVPAWGWGTLIVASILSLFVWFVQAPAGRFALMYFWILFAAVFTAIVSRLHELPWLAVAIGAGTIVSAAVYVLFLVLGVSPQFRSGMVAMIAFCVFWIVASGWAIAKRKPRLLAALCLVLGFYQVGERVLAEALRRDFAQVATMLWLPVTTLPEHIEKSQYHPRLTHQGLVVYQAQYTFYGTPLPNTRYFNPSLELRVPGDLRWGFRNPENQSFERSGYSVRVTTNGRNEEIIAPEQ